MPARVFSVQQGELVALLGSIHPFPSKEFFPRALCFSWLFSRFLFLSSFQSICTLGEGGGLHFLPCPAPGSAPSPRRGPGSGPGALAAPCRLLALSLPSRAVEVAPGAGEADLAKALAPRESRVPEPKAGCFHPRPVLGSPSSQHMCRAASLLVGGIGVFASPATAKGLMLPRSTRGHSQAIPRWSGGLTVLPGQGAEPTLGPQVPPWPLLHCSLWVLERSSWMLSPGCRAGVVSLFSPGACGWVLTGWRDWFGGARCRSLLQQSLGALSIPSTARAGQGRRLLGAGSGGPACCRAGALHPVSPLCEEEGVQVILLRRSWGTPAQGSAREEWLCQGRGGQCVCVLGAGGIWLQLVSLRGEQKPAETSSIPRAAPDPCGTPPLAALCWGLSAGGSAPPTQPHSLLAPHTPRLCRRLAEGLCYSPPPSPALKANLCSCGALAGGRLSASQMERHGGSPPFPACLLQTFSPDL